MASIIRVFNRTNVAVVVDDGRTIGAGEWAEVENTALVRQHIKRDRLLKQDVDDPEPKGEGAEPLMPKQTTKKAASSSKNQ